LDRRAGSGDTPTSLSVERCGRDGKAEGHAMIKGCSWEIEQNYALNLCILLVLSSTSPPTPPLLLTHVNVSILGSAASKSLLGECQASPTTYKVLEISTAEILVAAHRVYSSGNTTSTAFAREAVL